MFDKLDAIDWASLGGLQVPHLLRTLRNAEDSQIYGAAGSDLEDLLFPEEINNQQNWGVLKRVIQHELPHQVVPFLIDILKSTQLPNKQAMIIELLRKLSTYPYHSPLVNLDPENPTRMTFDKWASSLHSIIAQGLPIYQHISDNCPPFVKSIVTELIDNLASTQK